MSSRSIISPTVLQTSLRISPKKSLFFVAQDRFTEVEWHTFISVPPNFPNSVLKVTLQNLQEALGISSMFLHVSFKKGGKSLVRARSRQCLHKARQGWLAVDINNTRKPHATGGGVSKISWG